MTCPEKVFGQVCEALALDLVASVHGSVCQSKCYLTAEPVLDIYGISPTLTPFSCILSNGFDPQLTWKHTAGDPLARYLLHQDALALSFEILSYS